MNFETLSRTDLDAVLAVIPVSVLSVLRTENVVIAGGVIRDTVAGLPVKDVDIFCHSEEQAECLARRLGTNVRHTTLAYSINLLGTLVQFVYYKDFTDAKDLVRQFDFRACCAGIWFEPCDCDFVCVCGNGFYGIAVQGFREDCQSKTLRFMSQPKDRDKLTALRRALDFARKGWTISNDELASILLHWQGARPSGLLDEEYTDKHFKVVRCFRPGYGGRVAR